MLITLYRSKRDINGNTYFAATLTSLGNVIRAEKLLANNINKEACHRQGYDYVEIELGKRDFNTLTKDFAVTTDILELLRY